MGENSTDPDPASDPFRRSAKPLETVAEMHALLADKDEADRLMTLFEGDPLRLGDRAAEWLVEHCLLLDRRRLALKALTMTAASASALSVDDDLDEVLIERLDVSARLLLEEEGHLARENRPLAEPIEPRFHFLMGKLGFEPAHVRRACFAFNNLPEPERRVVHHVLVQRKGFARYGDEAGLDPREVRRLFKLGIEAMSRMSGEEGDDG